jgi:HEAT repeat protein
MAPSDKSWRRRRSEVERLVLDDNPDSFKKLVGLTRDSHEEVRRTAVEGLGERADPAAVPVLAEIAHRNEEDEFIRRAAVLALATMPGSPEAGQTLVDLAAHPADMPDVVLEEAALALGRVKAGSAEQTLTALLNHGSRHVRAAAMRALELRHLGGDAGRP